MPRFDKEGRYMNDAGEEEMKASDKAQLSLDPASIPGLEDFQPGDTVDLTIKARMGENKGEGLVDLEVLNVKAQPMDTGAKVLRREQKGYSGDMGMGEDE